VNKGGWNEGFVTGLWDLMFDVGIVGLVSLCFDDSVGINAPSPLAGTRDLALYAVGGRPASTRDRNLMLLDSCTTRSINNSKKAIVRLQRGGSPQIVPYLPDCRVFVSVDPVIVQDRED
jgi:hypothetical protein